MPRKFVFTITPGHTGTTFLAVFLQENVPGSIFHHELLGYDRFGVDTPDLSHFTLFNSRGNVRQIREFWTRKFAKLMAEPARIYGETSHLLAKAGLMENLRTLPDGTQVQIICLRRNPVKLVESMARRGDFVEKGNWWLWHLDPYYPRNIVLPKPYEPYGYNGLRYWYVCEMQARESYYKQMFANDSRVEFVDVDTQDLTSEEALQQLVRSIGGKECESMVIPPKKNVGPKIAGSKEIDEIRHMIEAIECEPEVAARKYLESGRTIG